MAYRSRLRIALPDRPGALGRIGLVIGGLGGNVLAIDVQEVDGPAVVDELLVDLPDQVGPAEVACGLEAAGAGSLLSAKPGSDVPDQVVRALRWACALASAGPCGADDELERAVAEVCGCPNVWLADLEQARVIEAARLALVRGRPVSLRTSEPPPALGPVAAAEVWLLAVPDARLEPARVALVARPLPDRFTVTEIDRVSALLSLRRLVAGTSAIAV
ncbi:MAG: hypothetical protein ABIS47_12135 [Acidimicrobiales bacterium]